MRSTQVKRTFSTQWAGKLADVFPRGNLLPTGDVSQQWEIVIISYGAICAHVRVCNCWRSSVVLGTSCVVFFRGVSENRPHTSPKEIVLQLGRAEVGNSPGHCV